MIGNWVFSEQTPSAPGTLISSAPVQNAASYLPKGVAGPLDDWQSLAVVFDIPANGSGGALNVYLQTSPDAGQNWYDVLSLPTTANAAPAKSYSAPLSLSTQTTTPVQVGKNGVPALAAGSVANGAFGDRLRLVMTAGAGTTSSLTISARISAQRKRTA